MANSARWGTGSIGFRRGFACPDDWAENSLYVREFERFQGILVRGKVFAAESQIGARGRLGVRRGGCANEVRLRPNLPRHYNLGLASRASSIEDCVMDHRSIGRHLFYSVVAQIDRIGCTNSVQRRTHLGQLAIQANQMVRRQRSRSDFSMHELRDIASRDHLCSDKLQLHIDCSFQEIHCPWTVGRNQGDTRNRRTDWTGC